MARAEGGGRRVALQQRAASGPPPVALLFSVAGLPAPAEERFRDEVLLEPERLDAVLRSLSFVGPALGPRRLAGLLNDVRALSGAHGGAVWSRELDLRWSRSG